MCAKEKGKKIDANEKKKKNSLFAYRCLFVFQVCRTGLKPFCKNDQLPDHENLSMSDNEHLVSCSWEHVLDVNDQLDGEPLAADHKIKFSLRLDYGPTYGVRTLGVTEMSIRDFIDMFDDGKGVVELMMWTDDSESDVVCTEIDIHDDTNFDLLPVIVRVSLFDSTVPPELIVKKDDETPSTKKKEDYAKRLVIITRGTRGDVQPFLALSRGLAEMKNWEIVSYIYIYNMCCSFVLKVRYPT